MHTAGSWEVGRAGSSTPWLEGHAAFPPWIINFSCSVSLSHKCHKNLFISTSFHPWKLRPNVISFVKSSRSPHPLPEQCWALMCVGPTLCTWLCCGWYKILNTLLDRLPLRLSEPGVEEWFVHLWNSTSSMQEVFSKSSMKKWVKEGQMTSDSFFHVLLPFFNPVFAFCPKSAKWHVAKRNIVNYTV